MTSAQVKPLRHAVVGIGAGVAGMHRPAWDLETVELVAGCDVNEAAGRRNADELGCAFYADHRTMLAETRPDVAVILTPHTFHAAIAIDCLRAGCHVLVEKPIAIHVAEADAMIAAAAQADRLLAVNFQQRHRPEVRAAYRLIREGRLGLLQHVDMAVAWTRPAVYFKLRTWRGTWAGEGGGVLMNQAPHNLDLICHLAGMPSRVVGWTRTQLQRIEVEDTVQAMLEWPGGAWGSLHISTAEAGRPERLEILGTHGYLQIVPGGVTFCEFDSDVRAFILESQRPFSAPDVHPVAVELEPGAGDHVAVYRNLHEAILRGAPLAADATEGRMSLELANAMAYSSHTRSAVDLPLDRQKYAVLLEDLKVRAAQG